MNALPFLLVALALGASLLAAAPAADARLACSNVDDATCDGTLCVWNPAERRFDCVVDWRPPPFS